MKRLAVVVAVAWSLTAGLDGDAATARGCRPTRRYCVGVTHQPCASASIRATRSQDAVSKGCICAFYEAARLPGYSVYYAIDYRPNCNTGYWCSLTGNLNTSNSDPCSTCPATQCIPDTYQASLELDRENFKTGTRLERKLKWNEELVLNSGTVKIKSASGTERTIQLDSRELKDARLLVSFRHGNALYFAKLHVCRLESQESDGQEYAVSDFRIGTEIEPPPTDQKVRDVTSQVTVLDSNVAKVQVGNTTYQVVTATSFSQ